MSRSAAPPSDDISRGSGSLNVTKEVGDAMLLLSLIVGESVSSETRWAVKALVVV